MTHDTEALIATLVRSVVEQLAQPSRPVALVLCPTSETRAREALTREVEQRLAQAGTPMRVCCEPPAEEPALYVVPEISCSDMADLAAGKASSLNMHRILDLLLAGKAVCTLGYTFHQHAHTAPLALIQLYESHAATLASYGLTELSVLATDATVREALVTAEHVQAAAHNGAKTLRVPYHALITPLAEQLAAEHHLTILKNL